MKELTQLDLLIEGIEEAHWKLPDLWMTLVEENYSSCELLEVISALLDEIERLKVASGETAPAVEA